MHFLDPVAEAVHDHPPDDGMIRIQRVPAAGVIGIAGAVLLEDVIGGVVESAEAKCRPVVVAFRSVVEDDVEDDLDAGPVQRLDHVPKFIDRAQTGPDASCRPGAGRRTRPAIAPVVDQARRAILGIELKHGQQFDGGDAELLKIGNLVDQSGVCAAGSFRHAGTGVA